MPSHEPSNNFMQSVDIRNFTSQARTGLRLPPKASANTMQALRDVLYLYFEMHADVDCCLAPIHA
jgi:hypothetical protein